MKGGSIAAEPQRMGKSCQREGPEGKFLGQGSNLGRGPDVGNSVSYLRTERKSAWLDPGEQKNGPEMCWKQV